MKKSKVVEYAINKVKKEDGKRPVKDVINSYKTLQKVPSDEKEALEKYIVFKATGVNGLTVQDVLLLTNNGFTENSVIAGMRPAQEVSSMHTCRNSTKLPRITKNYDFKKHEGEKLLDYGAGKYNLYKNHLEGLGLDVELYDKYNIGRHENTRALNQRYNLVTCNNVLNVIREDTVLKDVVTDIKSHLLPDGLALFTIYEGNKSGVGGISKKDCYQRNMKRKDYISLLEKQFSSVESRKGVIICKQ